MRSSSESRPLISVVIPCYNRSEVITRAVKSVLVQTYENLEVVIVDDGSDDYRTLETKLKNLDDSRIRLLRHQRNKNGAAARNTGISASRGELIAFLDSDDEWAPEKLALQFAKYEDLNVSNALIYTQSFVVTGVSQTCHPEVWPHKEIEKGERIGDYLFLHRGFIQTSSILISKQTALGTKFNEGLQRHQDYDLLLRLEAKGCSFTMIRKPLVLIHWEDLQSSGRGFNPDRSLQFLAQYGGYLSRKAASRFVTQQILLGMLARGQRMRALEVGCRHLSLLHLGLIDFINLVSYYIFADARISRALAKIKGLIR